MEQSTNLVDKRKKDRFYAKNSIFDFPELTEHSIVIYLYLCRCADGNGESFPSRKTIAAKCRMSIKTVDRSIKQLEDHGLLKKTTRISKNGDNTSNLYEIYDPPTFEVPNSPKEPNKRNKKTTSDSEDTSAFVEKNEEGRDSESLPPDDEGRNLGSLPGDSQSPPLETDSPGLASQSLTKDNSFKDNHFEVQIDREIDVGNAQKLSTGQIVVPEVGEIIRTWSFQWKAPETVIRNRLFAAQEQIESGTVIDDIESYVRIAVEKHLKNDAILSYLRPLNPE